MRVTPTGSDDAARARVVELEVALATELERRAELERKHDRLLGAYEALQGELELMKRRLFVAKAERIDTAQLELEFAAKLAALDALSGQIAPMAKPDHAGAGGADAPGGTGGSARTRKPTGRRDLRDLEVPEERIELPDAELEGRVPRLGSEEVSSKLMWRRGGWVRVVMARVKYRNTDAPADDDPIDGADATSEMSVEDDRTDLAAMSKIITARIPPELIPRSICTSSAWAHIISEKLCDGLPYHRQADRFARMGVPLDRGTMCRWQEQLGASVGATIVEAMREEAMRTAFCLATDATGILVQPIRGGDQPRRACQKGHFFVQIADADHVFFEYTPKETSAAVAEMFKGFSGYIQADAKSVYDFLFRPPERRAPSDDTEPDQPVCLEVGCWSHARRKIWETAITTKDPVAREALARVGRIFALDRTWKGRSHIEIKALRELHLRPHTDAFFAFVEVEYERVKDQRGMLRSALGYSVRQRGALTRFFDDGRLKLTNNDSERQLRKIATGRNAWLFCGSDDHAQAAGNLLSLIASARLHGLDPEAYLRDVFRVLPQWPRGRYLELAPKYWLATRARMDPDQLDVDIGWLTIPPPISDQRPASH